MATADRRKNLVDRIREIAVDLSGMAPESLDINANFLELGFDSLFLTQLSAAYQRAFGVRITFRQLFADLSSMSLLSEYLDRNLPADAFARAPQPQNSGQGAGAFGAPPAITEPVPDSAPPSFPVQDVSMVVPAAVRNGPPEDLISATAAMRAVPIPGALVSTQRGDLEKLFLQQLDLMSEQLRLLQGIPRGTEIAPIPLGAIVSAPSHEAPPVPDTAIPAASTKRPQAIADRPQPVNATPSGFGLGEVGMAALHPLPPRQQDHLDSLIAKYTAKTAGSKNRTQRHRRHLADPRTAAGFNRRWKEMVYPIWVHRSKGSKLWDVDGNEYIDLLNGFGPNFLGHAPDYIVESLEEQLHRGFEIGPQTPLVGEVAEMICKLTGMDRASFTCTGSEAVQAAMRLSRTVTGRDKVVVFSRDYHGNFDQVLVREANQSRRLRTLPSAPGIPFQSVDDTYVLEYGTDESLQVIKEHADDIAAVLVEPVQSRRPEFQPREFLHELRRITREAGIIFVFDEVITGFRSCPGGAQAYFGIDADLATYGKIIGGGMPIGVVAGRSAVMDTFDGGNWEYGDDSFPSVGVTFFAGTFVRHPLSIAAAHAALKHLIAEGPALQDRVNDRARRFTQRITDLFRRYDLNIEYPYFCSQMYLRIKEQSELANLLYFHLRYRGVHILEAFPTYMTDAHTEQDIDRLVSAFTDSIESLVSDGIIGKGETSLRMEPSPETHEPLTARPQLAPATVPAIPIASEHQPADTQRDMWVAAQMSQQASAASYGINVIELTGKLVVNCLDRAIDTVVGRHEALRSVFDSDGTKVSVKSRMPLKVLIEDLSPVTPSDKVLRVTDILNQEARQPFDLARGPLISFRLIRFSSEHHLLTFTAHMIVCDGWSFQVVLQEVSEIYSAYIDGREAVLAVPEQMRQYIDWQLKSGMEEARKMQKFWVNQFTTLPLPFELPGSGVRPPARTFEASRELLRLSPELCQSLRRVAKEQRNTPFALLLAAYGVWLHRLSGSRDFVVAVPFSGQAALGLNNLVGQCVHTLPFRLRMDSNTLFSDVLAMTRDLVLDAQENWNCNIGNVVRTLDLPIDASRLPLSSVMFNFDPPLSGVQFKGCTSRITSGPRYAFHYDLGFNVIDEGQTLVIECDYNTRLFDVSTIRCWLDGFQALLQDIFENLSRSIGRLPMISTEERAQLDKDHSALPRLSKRGAAKAVGDPRPKDPLALAVECGDQQLTYAQLDRRAERLARYLALKGVSQGAAVSLRLMHSVRLAVGVHAVAKLGCRFVPTEFGGPAKEPQIVLTDQMLSESMGAREPLSSSRQAPYETQSKTEPCSFSELAARIGIRSNDLILTAAPTPSAVLLAGAAGARLVILTISDPQHIAEAVANYRPTVLYADPPTWRVVLNKSRIKWGLRGLVEGDTLPNDVAAEVPRRCEEAWFLYCHDGTVAMAGRLESPDLLVTPLAGVCVSIVDANLEPTPVGVPGELMIGDVGTGTLTRRLHTHEINLLGRPERYVTVSGHRVSLNEIEVILLKHPHIRDAAVCVRDGVVAYVRPDITTDSDWKRELRAFLRINLPAYMRPSAIVLVDSLPRTRGGHLDWTALPAPTSESNRDFEDEYVAPRNATEQRLAGLWCEILKLQRVSVNADFFHLGGQSLLALAVFARIEHEFKRKLPLAMLFNASTIEALSAVLNGQNTSTSWSSLVPVQAKGSRPPLFLVHGAGGNILLYRRLGECMTPDYPVYGLQSQGLDGQSTPLRTIEEMAQHYLSEVRRVQPRGPYYLGGYCLGGTVAYEMAQILKRQGEDVPLVAMLDTYNFSRALRVRFHSFLLQKVRFHLANLTSMSAGEIYAYVREKLRLLKGGELVNLRNSMPGAVQPEGVGRATAGVEASIQAINDYAAEAYLPKLYPGKLALFKPKINYKFYPDPDMGWGDLALDGFDTVEVTVNPHSMLLDPYVKVLAEHLKARIDASSAGRSVLLTLQKEMASEPRQSLDADCENSAAVPAETGAAVAASFQG